MDVGTAVRTETGGWTAASVRAVAACVARGDADGALRVLRGRDVEPVLQLGGDALLVALAGGLESAGQVAERFASALERRGEPGDAELARELRSALGLSPPSPLRPLPVDLRELSGVLEGDPAFGGGRVDLATGAVHPATAEDVWRTEFGETLDLEEGAGRWLWIEPLGAKGLYEDMREFAPTVRDPERRTRLLETLAGPRVPRRFRDVLARWPEELERWTVVAEDRRRGRARAWLAALGYRPQVPAGA